MADDDEGGSVIIIINKVKATWAKASAWKYFPHAVGVVTGFVLAALVF